MVFFSRALLWHCAWVCGLASIAVKLVLKGENLGVGSFMKELISTNDVVLLSYAQNLLQQEGIDYALFDANMSVVEGSIGILPRRIMVADSEFEKALALLQAEPDAVIENGAGLYDQLSSLIDEEELTDDLFLGGALKILQPKKGFRSGIDAVLLAASVPDCGRMRVLEAGCGAGVVSLAIARRLRDVEVQAIEIEAVNAAIAMRNAARNELDNRVQIALGDLCDPVSQLELLGLQQNSFDYVVANPPFYDEGQMRFSPNPLRRRAKRAAAETLEEWVRFLTAMAAPKGVISLIHRAEKLDEILLVLSRRFGGVKVLPLFPRAGEPANRVIVQGVKGSRAPLTLLPGLVVHESGGGYTDEVKAMCQKPQGLSAFACL